MNLATSRKYAVAALVILAGAATGYLFAGRSSGVDRLADAARSLAPEGVEEVAVSRSRGHSLIVGAPSATARFRASEREVADAIAESGWSLDGRQVHPGGIQLHATGEGLQADVHLWPSGEADVQVEDAPPSPVERAGSMATGGLLAYGLLAAARRAAAR